MSIDPGKAQLLGKDPSTSNPLLVLATAIEHQTNAIIQIANNTTPEGRHIYAYEEVEPNLWVGYCLACSEAQKRFVHPCLDPQNAPPHAPPGTFQYGGDTPPVNPLSGD